MLFPVWAPVPSHPSPQSSVIVSEGLHVVWTFPVRWQILVHSTKKKKERFPQVQLGEPASLVEVTYSVVRMASTHWPFLFGFYFHVITVNYQGSVFASQPASSFAWHTHCGLLTKVNPNSVHLETVSEWQHFVSQSSHDLSPFSDQLSCLGST